MHLEELKKSAVVKYTIKADHHFNFSCTSLLKRISGYVDPLIMEVTEIHLNTNNFNRGSGFILIWDWYFVTNMLIRTKQGEHLTLPTSSH
jgi:hypothetical protein